MNMIEDSTDYPVSGDYSNDWLGGITVVGWDCRAFGSGSESNLTVKM